MGLSSSKNTEDIYNYLGGSEKLLNNVHELKNVENKLIEFLNSTGFISSGIQDFPNYINQITSDTDSSKKDFNANGNSDAISGIKDYMSDGLNMANVHSLDDNKVLETGYGLLNNINKSTLQFMDEDKAMLNYNINEITNMHNKLSNSVNNLKSNSNLNNNVLNLLNKTTGMLEQQKDYMNIIKNSDELSSIYNAMSTNVNIDNNLSLGKNILNYMNSVAKTASNLHNYRDIRKLYDDNKINFNSNSIKQMKSLANDLGDNMNFNTMSNYINKLYETIENNKQNVNGGGPLSSLTNKNLLLNKNWDSSDTVNDILSNNNNTLKVTGAAELKPLNFTNINENSYDGGMTLQNQLRNKLSVSNAARNNEIVKNANTLSEKLNGVSADLLSIVPELRRLDIIQLNDLEKIFKKFLYFTSFKYKNMYLILLDFFVDMQSSFIKQDFILKINNLIGLMEKGSSISSKLNVIGSKLSDIINFINKVSSEYQTKYGLTKDSIKTINDGPDYIKHDPSANNQSNLTPLSVDAYDTKINLDFDDIPDLTIVNTVIEKSVFRLLYSIRLSIYFKQLSETTNNHNKEYEELVGKSIGAEIDKIKQDYSLIMEKINDFEHNGQASEFKDDKAFNLNYPITVIPIPINLGENDVKYEYVEIKKIFMYLPTKPPLQENENNVRDHRAWGRTDVAWVDDETLRGVTLQNEPISGDNLRTMLTNYKEFFTNYYESIIGLYMAAQAIDIYLMQFTEKIKKTPEIIEKLDTLLSSSKIASMIHSNKSLDKLVNVFDPNNYHVVEDTTATINNNNIKDDVNLWSNLQQRNTYMPFNKTHPTSLGPNRRINSLLFHHYFNDFENNHLVEFDEENTKYDKYVDETNDELNANDIFYRQSSILQCGAGACDEIRPVIDLIMNRVSDNKLNHGGLHNRHWSSVPGKMDVLGKLIHKYSNVHDVNLLQVNDIKHKEDEPMFHAMGSSYYEKFTPDKQNKTPIQKMKELKEFYKNNTTLMNILSLFFSMLGIDDNTNTVLSPKTIQEYLTNFMCWGSYTFTHVPSTIDVNIGNGIPLSNNNDHLSKINIMNINFNGNDKDIGISIFSYFVSIDKTHKTLLEQYDDLFDYSNANIINVYEGIAGDWYLTDGVNLDNNAGNIASAAGPLPDSDTGNHVSGFMGENKNRIPFVNANNQYFSGKHMNNITLNKLIKTMSAMKRNIPKGLEYNLNNKQTYNRLENDMFKLNDVTHNLNILANANNPLFVGINDNLSVFNKNYTAMNIFDTNVRVTLIHANQLVEMPGSKYINTLQYKSQNLYSNVIKSIIGKVLTVIGLYDLNDVKNNKPWRTYIMDTTRLTLGGADGLINQPNIVRNDLVEYYIRIPLLLKFYKTIFYDITQDDDNLKYKVMNTRNESIKILPEFDYPFDALIKHYFMFSNDTKNNDTVVNTTFNKNLYININRVYDHFSKQNKSNMLTYISQQLVKEINQKYGLLFNSDLKLYKTRIAKYFGMDNDYVTSLYDEQSSLLYDDESLLMNTNEKQANLPSQKYTKVKNAYKNDSVTSYTNFSSKSYYDNIYDFRQFIQTVLTDSVNDNRFSEKYNLYSSFFDIEEYMNDIKNELKNNNNMNDDEKILFLSSATNSQKTSIQNTDANKKQLLYDFVITPLKQIDNLLNFLAHLRAVFSNEIIEKSNYSINAPNNWDPMKLKTSLFVLPSNSQILYNLTNNEALAANYDSNVAYAKSALYGYIPKIDLTNIDRTRNITDSYVPFNDMLVTHPLNYEYNYQYAFKPYDYIQKNQNIYTILDNDPNLNLNVNIKSMHDELEKIQRPNIKTNQPFGDAMNANNPNWLANDFKINNVTYNKSNHNDAYIVSNVLYIDSQYHNTLDLYDNKHNENTNNPSYGLLGNLGNTIDLGNIGGTAANHGMIYDANVDEPRQTGRRLVDGKLLGLGGVYTDNNIRHFPLDWTTIKTTNLRLIGCWCPEDLAPNRLGLHEYPYIKQGHLQDRAYNSTYSATEYLITKLLKNCDLFDINSTPNIRSSFDVLGNVTISFNKIDTLVKDQLYNITKLLNEFKTYVLHEYIHPCEFYLRTINSQYNALFVTGIKHQGGVNEKITMYEIQGRLNRFLSGSLTPNDISTDAKNIKIKPENENKLYLDPCFTENLNDNGDKTKLKFYGNDSNLLEILNKMGARLITKLINPLSFENEKACGSYVYNPKRLAYLPHQKLTSPLNTIDDKFYGKLSMEFFSDIQGTSPSSNVNMIKTTDILYSEPNPKHCNFYFTNIVNSVNYVVGTLLKAGSNIRDKKIYNKIIDIFKNHNEILSSTIDTRFDSIKHINYLGDYGRTGHGTYFDKSLPFVLYNRLNPEIDNYIRSEGRNTNNKILSFMTNIDPNGNLFNTSSFHHLSLSSIDGLSCEKLMSSFICMPPNINTDGARNLLYYNMRPDTNKDNYLLFKDTHEGMYPFIKSRYLDQFYDVLPVAPPGVMDPLPPVNSRLVGSFFGVNNIPKTNNKFAWYDIIGKPGFRQPLVNICEIFDQHANIYGANTGLKQPPPLPSGGAVTPIPAAPLPNFGEVAPARGFDPNILWNQVNLNKLNDARHYFSRVYSYGSIQQSNFIYDDISKYNLKSVIINTYNTDSAKYHPFIENNHVNFQAPTKSSEHAARWLKSINDPLKFFSKLQPFGNNVPNDSYILGIVSESLHGKYSPHIISNVSNGPRSMNFKGITNMLEKLNSGDFRNMYGVDSQTAQPGAIPIGPAPAGAGAGAGAIAAAIGALPAPAPSSADVVDPRVFLMENYNQGKMKINELNAPHELQLNHIQYTKDHLRYGQAIAAYNPLMLTWETYQPLQYDINAVKKRDYNHLEKIQIKNKDSNYTNMFYKLSYAKLLTDLLIIDSTTRLNKLQGQNNVLYSLSLSSAYSTPRNEYYGSSLFEYRPTFLNETHIDKKLYVSPFLEYERFAIDTDGKKFSSMGPYDPILSLEVGATGYWEPTGRHPVMSEAHQIITSFIVNNPAATAGALATPPLAGAAAPLGAGAARKYYVSAGGDLFGIKTQYGLQNGVLQPKEADASRFGYMIHHDIAGNVISKYPDAYVPLEQYLQGKSILNQAERGIKEMAKEMHDIIFNKSAPRLKEFDDVNNRHHTLATREAKLSTNSLTKAALIALSTCDSRMGPYNILSAVEDVSGVLPKTKTLTTGEKLITGGAEFTGNDSSQHNVFNGLSTNILSIALRNSDEPLAVSFQDNDKSITNGNILLKTYATVIKNMMINWNANMDSKRNIYDTLTDVASDTKENLAAAIPYLLHEIEILKSQIKLLQYYVTNNKYVKDNKTVLDLNLKQANTIVNILQQGLESMKNDFNIKYIFGEQYSGHLNAMTENPSQKIPNMSFSAELYNFLSNCNEGIIRPLGSHNVYYKLNDITKNSHASFFKRLFAIRKLYDKSSQITCDECPSITKSINKLNVLLDKYTRKIDKSLIENIINTCKKIKFTPFEESAINQFVCLTNNMFTNITYNAMNNIAGMNNIERESKIITASIAGFSKFFNIQNENLDELNILDDVKNQIHAAYKSKQLSPLNSLLFITNESSDNINTVNLTLGDDSLSNDDIKFYNSYNDCFDTFVKLVNNTDKYDDRYVPSIYSFKNSLYDKNNDDHYQLMVFNILDLNILPIDINALTREIPLFYLFNYSTSLDEFLSNSMEAYNTNTYHNDVINNRTVKYMEALNEYLMSISPNSSDYYIDLTKFDKLDINKTLYHNKFSHMNPQLDLITQIWNNKKYNNNMNKSDQVDGYNQMEFLTKFNTITNLISNIFTATSSHKLNSVDNLLNMSKSYKYDYSHYSSSLYYNGIDLNITKSPIDFYKNVTYNSSELTNSYTTVYNTGSNNLTNYVNNAIKALESYKTIIEFVNIKYNNIAAPLPANINDLGYNQHINNFLTREEENDPVSDYLDNNSFMGSINYFNTTELYNSNILTDHNNYEKIAKELASSSIYGARNYIMGYSDNNIIYTDTPNIEYFYKKTNTRNNQIDPNTPEFNGKALLHNIYLNSYVKHNNYNCMFNINHKQGILYTNTSGKKSSLTYQSSINEVFNDDIIHSYEICQPGFETNLCKNWLKLNKYDFNEYGNLDRLLQNNRVIDNLINNGKTSNNISPNPHYFNNILMPSNDKYELYRELPYTTFYNLSCLLSDVNDKHIESITKLQKLENAHFMNVKLNEWVNDKKLEFKNAVTKRAKTSWGISDPRSLAFLGDQEILYKKIKYFNNVNERIGYEKPDLHGLRRRNKGNMSNSLVTFNPHLVCNRHPISFDEYYVTLESIDKKTVQYNFIPNVNNISSDWAECNKSSKLHTSNKWLRIKPKTLFNHVLPISDAKGFGIYPVNYANDILMSGGNRDLANFYNISDMRTHRYHYAMDGEAVATRPRPARMPSDDGNIDRRLHAHDYDALFYPKSCPLGLSLVKNEHNKALLESDLLTGAAITEGVCASDLHAAGFNDSEKARKIHVLSHIMFNDKTFGYVPLRHLMLLDLGYNFIRYKITQENLYTTNKIISGSLLYDSEYHNDRVYEEAYGIKNIGSMAKKGSIVPRVKSINNSKRPSYPPDQF